MKPVRDIIISTFFGSPNYGTNLQAIALNRILTKMGFKVYMLDNIRIPYLLFRHPILLYARVYNKLNEKERKEFFSSSQYTLSDRRLERLSQFNKKNYRTISFYNLKQWNRMIRKKPVFMSGADIIWNPAIGYPAKHFLDYAYYAGQSRFSFGSSIGAAHLPPKFYKAYKRYLGSMIQVGVREQSVADELESIIGRPVTKVVDPSLLMNSVEWDTFAEKAEISVPIKKEGFVLCYFVMNDSRYWDYVKKIEEVTHKQIIVLPMNEQDEIQPYDVLLDGTPYEFVWLVKNADFICTDSFHACALSLIYKKEFYLLRRKRKDEDAKYDDFLGRYSLTNRIVTDESCFSWKPFTDYKKAEKILDEDRALSMRFLMEVLEKC